MDGTPDWEEAGVSVVGRRPPRRSREWYRGCGCWWWVWCPGVSWYYALGGGGWIRVVEGRPRLCGRWGSRGKCGCGGWIRIVGVRPRWCGRCGSGDWCRRWCVDCRVAEGLGLG